MMSKMVQGDVAPVVGEASADPETLAPHVLDESSIRGYSQGPVGGETSSCARVAVCRGSVVTDEEARQGEGSHVVGGKPLSTSGCPASCAPATLPDGTTELNFDFGFYVGHVDASTGLRHGHGVLYYTSGNVYDGEWRDGAANGIGEKRYANGDVFRGMWRGGKRSGRGSYLHADGHFFEGMYEDDEANGYGIFSTVGGDRYTGQWARGKKEGRGREMLRGGQVFVGQWRDGKKHGYGKMWMEGAKRCVYGVWEDNRFLRELTKEERNQEGDLDGIDEFGLVSDHADAVGRSTTRTASANRERQHRAEGSDALGLDSLAASWKDRVWSGIAAVEGRVEALGKMFEHMIVANAPTGGHVSENPKAEFVSPDTSVEGPREATVDIEHSERSV